MIEIHKIYPLKNLLYNQKSGVFRFFTSEFLARDSIKNLGYSVYLKKTTYLKMLRIQHVFRFRTTWRRVRGNWWLPRTCPRCCPRTRVGTPSPRVVTLFYLLKLTLWASLTNYLQYIQIYLLPTRTWFLRSFNCFNAFEKMKLQHLRRPPVDDCTICQINLVHFYMLRFVIKMERASMAFCMNLGDFFELRTNLRARHSYRDIYCAFW